MSQSRSKLAIDVFSRLEDLELKVLSERTELKLVVRKARTVARARNKQLDHVPIPETPLGLTELKLRINRRREVRLDLKLGGEPCALEMEADVHACTGRGFSRMYKRERLQDDSPYWGLYLLVGFRGAIQRI